VWVSGASNTTLFINDGGNFVEIAHRTGLYCRVKYKREHNVTQRFFEPLVSQQSVEQIVPLHCYYGTHSGLPKYKHRISWTASVAVGEYVGSFPGHKPHALEFASMSFNASPCFFQYDRHTLAVRSVGLHFPYSTFYPPFRIRGMTINRTGPHRTTPGRKKCQLGYIKCQIDKNKALKRRR